MTPNNAIAERAQEARDLRGQLAGLNGSDQQEIVFQDTSRRPAKVPLWRLRDGLKVMVPVHLLTSTLAKRDDKTGEYMFTAHQEQAPEFVPGTLKCFLNPDADPETRKLVESIGLGTIHCARSHIPSEYQARVHAQTRHSTEWRAYQEEITRLEQQEYRDQQRAQTEATLALARAAAANVPVTEAPVAEAKAEKQEKAKKPETAAAE